jgi:hypothetical protein
LYVEQVVERKLACVVHGKAALKPASARHQQVFLVLVLTAAGLLARIKSATHAKRQHVLVGWRLLADDAYLAPHTLAR